MTDGTNGKGPTRTSAESRGRRTIETGATRRAGAKPTV